MCDGLGVALTSLARLARNLTHVSAPFRSEAAAFSAAGDGSADGGEPAEVGPAVVTHAHSRWVSGVAFTSIERRGDSSRILLTSADDGALKVREPDAVLGGGVARIIEFDVHPTPSLYLSRRAFRSVGLSPTAGRSSIGWTQASRTRPASTAWTCLATAC